MGKTLQEIAQELKDNQKKVQLIYAFNGTGKTRLSREFKELFSSQQEQDEETEAKMKVIYYNAFTEDLFHWDNDLDENINRKLLITPNSFTDWVLREEGQEANIISNFQHYTNDKLMPNFIENYTKVSFSLETGDDQDTPRNIKISRGEESCFIWCVFYSLFQQIVGILNIPEKEARSTDKFDDLEYIFIDDPVSSLDENHLIELAVNIAELIKSSKSDLKFVITTHNPLFYNVLYNEFHKENFQPYKLEKIDNQNYVFTKNSNDSPFAYQIHLKHKLEDLFKEEIFKDDLKNLLNDEYKKSLIEDLFKKFKEGLKENELKSSLNQFAELNDLYIKKIFVKKDHYRLEFFRDKKIEECQVEKYHFNFMRNILEKMSTFLGYYDFKELLPRDNEGSTELYAKRIYSYANRIVNFGSHSKHSAEEISFQLTNDKRVLKNILNHLNEKYFRAKYMKFSDFNKK
uniref:anticodon nuclease n=1 Tax=Ornithobacterium rhinotracheale TaxID=28251 RepID=UPI0039A43C29